MNYLNWSEATKGEIEAIVLDLRQLQSDILHNDPTPEDIEEEWKALHQRATTLYQEGGVSHRIQQIESLSDDEWPKMEDLLQEEGWPTYWFSVPGPDWDTDDEYFEDFLEQDTAEEISEGSAALLADSLSELLKPDRITAKNRKLLRRYADILRERLELVEGILEG